MHALFQRRRVAAVAALIVVALVAGSGMPAPALASTRPVPVLPPDPSGASKALNDDLETVLEEEIAAGLAAGEVTGRELWRYEGS